MIFASAQRTGPVAASSRNSFTPSTCWQFVSESGLLCSTLQSYHRMSFGKCFSSHKAVGYQLITINRDTIHECCKHCLPPKACADHNHTHGTWPGNRGLAVNARSRKGHSICHGAAKGSTQVRCASILRLGEVPELLGSGKWAKGMQSMWTRLCKHALETGNGTREKTNTPNTAL